MRNAVPTTGRLHGGVFGMGYGGALYPFGGASYPFGGALGFGVIPAGGADSPFGGAMVSTTGMGRQLFSRPKPYIDDLRRVYMLPTRYQLYGGGVLDSFKAGAKRLMKSGKEMFSSAVKKAIPQAKQMGRQLGSQALDTAEKELGRQLRDLTITAKHKVGSKAGRAAIDQLSSLGSTQLSRGSQAIRKVAGMGSGVASEAGQLSAKQVRALTQPKGAVASQEVAPTMDTHEVRLMRNIVEGKRIVGRGLKKM